MGQSCFLSPRSILQLWSRSLTRISLAPNSSWAPPLSVEPSKLCSVWRRNPLGCLHRSLVCAQRATARNLNSALAIGSLCSPLANSTDRANERHFKLNSSLSATKFTSRIDREKADSAALRASVWRRQVQFGELRAPLGPELGGRGER